ncbi:MAG: clostripain-related cysteine peptidase [Odoribacter sp.]|nr:clostripain-related cysteine peptidase [Odoribacter sp.]
MFMRVFLNVIKIICLGFCSILSFISCADSDTIKKDIERTVLVYMAADNNLSSFGNTNIQLMLQGMKNVEGRLVIYLDPSNDVPRLMVIEGNSAPKLDTLVTYSEENSASPEVLRRTIQDVRNLYPSNSYGLILWSHGMGWLPEKYNFHRSYSAGLVRYTNLPTKYFGQDTHPGDGAMESFMETDELMAGISGHFNFIMFDACFMGAVEVLYGLRDYADYFIASPAEILANGFPYDKIVPWLWGDEEDLKRVCAEYFNYYNTYPDPNNAGWNSATVALVKSSELQHLVELTSNIVGENKCVASTDVWRYPLSKSSLPNVFYDLGDYINTYGDESQQSAYKQQLEKTVVFKAATPTFFGQTIPTDKFSGLSVYIPQTRWDDMNQIYYQLEWARTVYGK